MYRANVGDRVKNKESGNVSTVVRVKLAPIGSITNQAVVYLVPVVPDKLSGAQEFQLFEDELNEQYELLR
jgi:hypothetical protein